MSLRLYFDVHVNIAILQGLQKRGVDVLRSQDDGASEFSDPQLLDRALELGRVLFTQDDDFLKETARRQRSGESFIGVIYAHQLKISVGQCIAELELMAKVCESDELAGLVTHLPL